VLEIFVFQKLGSMAVFFKENSFSFPPTIYFNWGMDLDL
jgi:hypothetical protein